MVVPEPAWFTEPLPLITPEWVMALDRLKVNTALFVIAPAMAPVVPPTPTCNSPAVMMVTPV